MVDVSGVILAERLVAEQVVAAGDWDELTERAWACRRAIEGG